MRELGLKTLTLDVLTPRQLVVFKGCKLPEEEAGRKGAGSGVLEASFTI